MATIRIGFVRVGVLSLSFALLWPLMAASQTRVDLTPRVLVEALSRNAELIFHGKVSDVEYRTSVSSDPSTPVTPYTFVTYQINSIFKGSTANRKQITLRFLGGPLPDGSVVFSASTPLFAAGDEDLLFVRGNGELDCPLVGCANGRLRLLDGQLYDNDGAALVVDPSGHAVKGSQSSHPVFTQRQIGDVQIGRSSGRPNAVNQERPQGPQVRPLRISDIQPIFARQAREDDGNPRTVPSARPDIPIKASGPSLAAGRPPEPASRPAPPSNEAERREMEAAERAGGSPVLPERQDAMEAEQ